MAVVQLRGIRVHHPDGTVALDGVDLRVGEGEVLGLLGPSGSGKTTLLRVIAGLQDPTYGSIRLDGREVTGLPPRERNVALVAQQRTLAGFLTVAEELAFPLEIRQLGQEEVDQRTRAERRAFGLSGLWRRRLPQLSGGQAQRTALARAMVRLPDVLLLDEPLQRLDPPSQSRLRAELRRMHRARPTTTVYATNVPAQLMGLVDRIVVLDGGRVLQDAPVEEVLDQPADRWVAGFVGGRPMAFVEAVVVEEGGLGWLEVAGQRIRVPGGLPGALRRRVGQRLLLGARPDAVRAAEPGDAVDGRLSARVVLAQPHGPHDEVAIAVPGGEWVATFPPGSGLRPGDEVEVSVAVRRMSAFDPSDGRAVWHGAGSG